MPGELENILVPIFGMVTGIVITGFVVLGPVGRAVGRVILRVFGADRDQALPPAELGDLRDVLAEHGGRLETMQQQLGELAERQDFTERLLAQAREKRGLPEGRAP
jgi:hypothetical protein